MRFDRVIDQRLGARDEAQGMWQSRVRVERRLIFPTRVNVEELRIANRAERTNAEAASFLAGRHYDLAQRLLHCCLISRQRLKTGEDKNFHAVRFCLESNAFQNHGNSLADP